MVLGIDIGTSGVKSTIVDFDGRIRAYSYRIVTTYGIREQKRELNPMEVGEKVFETIREVLSQTRSCKIELITISALGEAIIPIAFDGKVLMDSILGSDPRGAEEMRWIQQQLGEKLLTDITGVNPSYIYSINKILYIKKHAPQIHKQVWKYMCFTDYMGYLLTKEAKIDYSMASRTMAFDIHKKQWSGKILGIADIDDNLFSDPVQGGQIIGNICNDVKERFGLNYDIPVMVGSHDHIYNALGAGAVSTGICSNTVGTTEGITTVLEEIISSENILANNISCEPFVLPNMYNTVAWHNTAGGMVNWYVDTFYKESSKNRNEILEELGKGITEVPSKLMVLPHFSGETAKYMDELAKGGILGLTMTTTREEIYKAILEGSSYECRIIIECIEKAKIPIKKIIISGGGSKSFPWMKIKANILGREVYKSAFPDTGAIGGAILGAVVTGHYGSLKEAYPAMIPLGELIEPDMNFNKVYNERYEEYKELYCKMKKLNHKLS